MVIELNTGYWFIRRLDDGRCTLDFYEYLEGFHYLRESKICSSLLSALDEVENFPWPLPVVVVPEISVESDLLMFQGGA